MIYIPLFVVVVVLYWAIKSFVRSYPIGDYISNVLVSSWECLISARDEWRRRHG